MGFDAIITTVTILVVLIALFKEVTRPDVIFMGGLLVLMVTGVLSPSEAFSGFSNPAVFTVAALFVVAAGIQRTRALRFLDKVVFVDGYSPRNVLTRMMASTAAMSSFLNNTPIVAMLIPQVQQWSERTGIHASKLLIPLSYAAIVGGIITLIGTSTNIIVSSMLDERGIAPLHLFELTWIGLPAAVLLIIWFATIGYRLLPDRNPSIRSSGDTQIRNGNGSGYQMDLMIGSGSDLIGKTVEDAGLRGLVNAFLIHAHRHGRTIGPVGPHFILEEGDLLTFIGDVKAIDELSIRKGLSRNTPVLDGSEPDLPLFEAVVAPTSIMIGKTLKQIDFRSRFHAVVIGIQRQSDEIRGALGNLPIVAGDLLLIEAKDGFDDMANNDKDNFYLVNRRGFRQLPLNSKATLALAITVSMIAVATLNLVPIVTAALVAAAIMIYTGCVKKEQIMASLNLPILLVIASALGFGQAIETSGLASTAAFSINTFTSEYGHIAIVAGIYILTNILTELITNNAAAVLMLPIALALAVETGITPHAMAVTVAIAASASFLTPIGYQTNLMVMGAGRYRFKDYLKAGFPVTIILFIVTIAAVEFVWNP
jgi:di/tricarboxylate transporter